VRNCFFPNIPTHNHIAIQAAQHKAVQCVALWESRGNVPLAAQATANIVEGMLLDSERGTTSTDDSLRLLYSMALLRMVNGLVDIQQKGEFAASVSFLAGRIGLPQTLVRLLCCNVKVVTVSGRAAPRGIPQPTAVSPSSAPLCPTGLPNDRGPLVALLTMESLPFLSGARVVAGALLGRPGGAHGLRALPRVARPAMSPCPARTCLRRPPWSLVIALPSSYWPSLNIPSYSMSLFFTSGGLSAVLAVHQTAAEDALVAAEETRMRAHPARAPPTRLPLPPALLRGPVAAGRVSLARAHIWVLARKLGAENEGFRIDEATQAGYAMRRLSASRATLLPHARTIYPQETSPVFERGGTGIKRKMSAPTV